MHRIPCYLAFAIAMLAFVAIGCGTSEYAPNARTFPEVRTTVQSETATPSKSPWQATTVVDRTGHSITLEHAPQRIVSLLPSATELLFAIGAGPAIVGATKHCNFPAEALEIPRVGSGLLEGTSRETILALKPDLVLCKWDTHEPLMALFDRVQIPALNLGAETLEELFVEAKLLGRVTGHDQGAEALIQRMTDRREQLMHRVATLDVSQQRTVFYEVWGDPLMTAGPKSFIGELLKMGRMKNIFDDTEVPYPRISSEVVVARNPDVILAPSSHAQQVEPATLASRPGWSNIHAVAKHQIYAIDGDEVSRCGPRMLNALEQMIDAVYPETKLKDPSTP